MAGNAAKINQSLMAADPPRNLYRIPTMRCLMAAILLFSTGCAGGGAVADRGALMLHSAAWRGDINAVRTLLDAGADVNAVAPTQWASTIYTARGTPLHFATFKNHGDIVRLLVDRGANIKATNVHGYTPLDIAEKLGRTYIAVILMEADKEAFNKQRSSDPSRTHAAAPQHAPPAASSPSVSDVDNPRSLRPENPDDFALIIGIEKYPRLPEARFAEHDADAVKAHMRALGYPERNIVILKGGLATRGAIQGYVEEWLPKNTKPTSRVFVYFSGHGSPDVKTGDAYLVPADGDTMFLKSTAYPLNSLYASLGRLKAKRVLVALDSCFSGAGGRSVLPEGARPLVARIEAATVPVGLTILSAAAGDEITATLPEQSHGAFTYYMLKALSSGKLTAKTAYEELKPRVQDEAHRQNREQTPQLIGGDAEF